MRKAVHRLSGGLALLALALLLTACGSGRGYRSDSYTPSGYVYYPTNSVTQGGVANGFYYGPRNESDRPASNTDFDWGGSRRP